MSCLRGGGAHGLTIKCHINRVGLDWLATIDSRYACEINSVAISSLARKLAQRAPLILRARVVGEDAWDRTLVVEPLEALKGTLPERRIEISVNGLVPEDERRSLS